MAGAKVSPRFDSQAQEAYLSLWRSYDRLRAIEDECFARYELTPQQYNVLRLLRRAHPESVATLSLAGRLVSRAPDITRMLDKLEARGLTTRVRSTSDRRAVLIGITEEGLGLLDEIADPLAECHERQLGHLSAEELESLIHLLRLVRDPHESAESSWR
ncbi:MarR family transcriptional regulator [bacterium]|nr:MarR family transcriptional regulator [bacterium]